MNETFRKSMTWLHTWFGIVMCWIMYFMFVTGTLGYFDTEIDQWMQPEVPVSQGVPLVQSLDVAEKRLVDQASDAERWFISPVKERQNPQLFVSWNYPKGDEREFTREKLDIETGQVIDESVRETGGGQTLYRMHYLLHYIDRDIIYPIIGVITFLMFVGVVTGIVIHRKIFTDFFTFRPRKGGKSWLDIHNLMSVTSLPFQLMISYSGLIFMITTFFPLIAIGTYGFDAKVAREELPKLLNTDYAIEAAGERAKMLPLTAFADKLDEGVTANDIRNISVKYPNDANAIVSITLSQGIMTRGDVKHVFSAVTGEQLATIDLSPNGAFVFANSMLSLHEGLFADTFVRWLYFLAGIAGTVMIATGAVYWVKKRETRLNVDEPNRGFYLVQNLNIGTIAGLLTAIGAYFWANRLLPLGIDGRADWEVHVMFLTWLVCLVHPFVRKNKRKAWVEQCYLGALVFLTLPMLNALTTDIHLINTLTQGNWVLASFDLMSLFTGLVFVIVAKYLTDSQAKISQAKKHKQANQFADQNTVAIEGQKL